MDPSQANDQKMRILALNAKDFKLPPGNLSLAHLNVRQAAYCMANCVSYVLPTDLLEIGGEMDSWTHSDMHRCGLCSDLTYVCMLTVVLFACWSSMSLSVLLSHASIVRAAHIEMLLS